MAHSRSQAAQICGLSWSDDGSGIASGISNASVCTKRAWAAGITTDGNNCQVKAALRICNLDCASRTEGLAGVAHFEHRPTSCSGGWPVRLLACPLQQILHKSWRSGITRSFDAASSGMVATRTPRASPVTNSGSGLRIVSPSNASDRVGYRIRTTVRDLFPSGSPPRQGVASAR